MYLHLGQDSLVNTGELIGLFDLDTTTLAKASRDFLAGAEKAGRVVNVSSELPKSYVLTAPRTPRTGPQRVYISQISAQTLKKRLGAR